MACKLTDNKLKILVLGYIIRGPIAGMTWHHIQYVLGLNSLGHDVSYYEDSGSSHYCCYNPITGITNDNPFYGIDYLKKLFTRLKLENNWAYYNYHKDEWNGNKSKSYGSSAEFDLLINLSASNQIRDWMLKIPIRVMIDTDPVFTQIRNLRDPLRKELASKHNVFFTFGENINSPECQIPSDGFNWQTTRQPIALDLWSNKVAKNNGRFTNIMQWESYRPLEFNGTYYGLKSDSFAPYIDMPNKTMQKLEIALGSSNAPRQELRNNKWALTNPLEISKDPWGYQWYIQHSKAEFSIAKHAYVKSFSGWFSERSACYLASGRPVLAQDTGFSEWIETGKGLLRFSSPDEALQAIDDINSNYEQHCKKARELAMEHFNCNNVLGELIDNSMNDQI